MKKLLLMLLVIGLLGILACGKDDSEEEQLNDQEQINQEMNDMAQQSQEVYETQGMQALMQSNVMMFELFAFSGEEIFKLPDYKPLFESLYASRNVTREDWDYWTGTWEFSDTLYSWVNTDPDNPSDRIRLVFDYIDYVDGGTVSGYFDIMEFTQDENGNLTAMGMELWVDGNEEMSFEMTAEWDSENELVNLTIEGMLDVFTYMVSMSEEVFTFELREGNDLIYGLEINMSVEMVDGELAYVINSVEFAFGSIEMVIDNFNEDGEYEEGEDIGDFYMDGEKRGDLIVKYEYNEETQEDDLYLYLKLPSGVEIGLNDFFAFLEIAI